MATMIGDSDDNIPFNEVDNLLLRDTWEGDWHGVIMLYQRFPRVHRTFISYSAGTALHVAIDLDKENVVKELINAILTHNNVEALEKKNERGDTPLHFAASRGFTQICKWIIGSHNERIYLLNIKNKHGEAPLFQAAMNWRKQTFAYLAHTSKDIVTLLDLVRYDGDSILHTAIRGEYFDLALIIVSYYPSLIPKINIEGYTPLKVLATRPSSFFSTCNISWYKRILYHGILVDQLDVEQTIMMSNLEKMEARPDPNKMKFPENYTTLYEFVSKSLGAILFVLGIKKKLADPLDNDFNRYISQEPVGYLPPNYKTFYQFVRSAFVITVGLLGVELKDVRIAKQKHIWSSQLLKSLLDYGYEAFTGEGAKEYFLEEEVEENRKRRWLEKEELEEKKIDENNEQKQEMRKIYENEREIKDKRYTPLLVAARNGIVEMVNEILIKIPSYIYNTNSREENVLLVAVKYKQPLIMEAVKKNTSEVLWKNMMLATDWEDNTVMHFAAEALSGVKPWKMAGSALQMMWDIKWFQYIKSLVPQHFYFRTNNNNKTPGEIFKESHVKLIEESSNWLKETSESCSVVAALVAGVSFATASTVPGGNSSDGRPTLEREPAFDVFAISSLISLCFSVTGLIMFLTILTSRKQAKDFRQDLPLKLFLGLSSLFVAIASMFVSFCTAHFFLLNHRFRSVLLPIYIATSLPVTFYAVAQFPLYDDLLKTVLLVVPVANNNVDGL